MTKRIKLMIACHKKVDVPHDPLYLPVQVGAVGKDSIGFQRDDEGENISSKNPLYCELTGMYWCWKNLDVDYIGFVHYRRYFTMKKSHDQEHPLDHVLTMSQAEQLLDQYKVIVPKKRRYYIYTIYDHYSSTFTNEHLDLTKQILENKYPEYIPSWDKVMKSRSAYIFNMYIMSKEMNDSYCTWLFDILGELTKKVDVSKMTAFEKRYAGRVSERLFNVWLTRQLETGELKKSDIHEVPYMYIGKVDWAKKISGFLQAKFCGKKYDKSF